MLKYHTAAGHRPPTPRRRRGPMTAVDRQYQGAFVAPVSEPGTRAQRECWSATSRDGLWRYDRVEDHDNNNPWMATYNPTGQFRELFGRLDDAREATAGDLLAELRQEAGRAAFHPTDTAARLAGQRWLAVHMRLAGADEADARCDCGGLLVSVNQAGGLYAHVDACAECWTYGAAGIAARTDACEHLVCANPFPLRCEHWTHNGCAELAKPTQCRHWLSGGECCGGCCSGE